MPCAVGAAPFLLRRMALCVQVYLKMDRPDLAEKQVRLVWVHGAALGALLERQLWSTWPDLAEKQVRLVWVHWALPR